MTRYPSHSQSRSTSSASTSSSSRSRSSSATVQPTAPPSSTPRRHEPHIRFAGSGTSNRTPKDVMSSSESSPEAQKHDQRPRNAPPPSPRLQPTHLSTVSLNSSVNNSPSRIKVRDLGHIQSFASEEFLTRSRQPSRQSLRGKLEGPQQYEISAMPVQDIIEMVAGLLTRITTQNDQQHASIHRQFTPQDNLTQQASSVLAFHGKNVPSITINSYLMRIHKYCPTTYEVFLSLLIYFDRMTHMINQGTLSSFPEDERKRTPNIRTASTDSSQTVRPDSPMSMSDSPAPESSVAEPEDMPGIQNSSQASDAFLNFVVDSFNIHRLVMAGVTCASKFFSDVFYTNSRYAKVRFRPPLPLYPIDTCPYIIFRREMRLLTFPFLCIGWRSTSRRTQSPGTSISPPQ